MLWVGDEKRLYHGQLALDWVFLKHYTATLIYFWVLDPQVENHRFKSDSLQKDMSTAKRTVNLLSTKWTSFAWEHEWLSRG